MEITERPYAEWLEGLLRCLADNEIQFMGFTARTANDQMITAYWGCNAEEKLILAGAVQADAIFDTVYANADRIVEHGQEQLEQDDE